MKKLIYIIYLLAGCLSASAYDFESGGIYYNITDDSLKTVEVTYRDFSYDYHGYEGAIKIPEYVVYNNTNYCVTSIGERAFFICDALTSVEIGDSVEIIRRFAFEGCIALTSIEIKNSVKTIEYAAFRNCVALRNIEIGNSVEIIGNGAFDGCESLTSIEIGNSVKTIEYGAFRNCVALSNVEIGNSVEIIGNEVFHGCDALNSIVSKAVTPPVCGWNTFDQSSYQNAELQVPYGCKDAYANSEVWKNFKNIGIEGTEFINGLGYLIIDEEAKTCTLVDGGQATGDVVIPEKVMIKGSEYTVTEIGDGTFGSCKGLTGIEIPNSVITIGKNTFYDCNNLTKVEISDIEAWCKIEFANEYSNPLWIAHHLYLNGNEITELTIPETVSEIKDYAFVGCSGLTNVDIPNSVTIISDFAFGLCTGLTNIQIPNSVTTIGRGAFFVCEGLTNVVISESVTTIEEQAFDECISLTSVICKANIPPLCGNGAFGQTTYQIAELQVPYGCKDAYTTADVWKNFQNIVEVIANDIVDGLGYAIIDEEAKACSLVDGKQATGNVVIPEKVMINGSEYTVTEIGEFAFNFCDLISVEIPNTVITISRGAFCDCNQLAHVKIGSSVTTIGDLAFSGGAGGNLLESVEIPSSVKSIGQNAFWNSKLTKVEISDIGAWCKIEFADRYSNPIAFAHHLYLNGSEITELIIPETTSEIKDNAFVSCYGLTSVIIPNSVTVIRESAFGDCTGLTNVIISESVTTIEERAFLCTSLTSVVCKANIPPVCGYETFFQTTYHMAELQVPYGCKEVYAGADVWRNFSKIGIVNDIVEGLGYAIIDEEAKTCSLVNGKQATDNVVIPEKVMINGSEYTVVEIYERAFEGCTGLTSIEIPNSVISIGENAFSGCPLETLVIGCKNIGNGLFRGIDSLKKVTLCEGVESIGSQAFSNCSISEIEFPASLTSIGGQAFYNNPISVLTLDKNIKEVLRSAFSGCPIEELYVNTSASINTVFTFSHLKKAVFGDDAVTIPSFRGAAMLSEIVLPTPMEVIPDDCFNGCVSLESVILPPALTSIGYQAFAGCESLQTLELPEYVKFIGARAFENCTSLYGILLSKKLEIIGEYAFHGCSALKTVRMPENVTFIPQGLFMDCAALEKVYLSDNATAFGEYAFANCPSLKSMIIPEGVKSVPAYMLHNCTSLNEILIPNTVTSIGERAFAGCVSLRNIDLGKKVYEIANYAFEGCHSITDIHSMAPNPPYADLYTFPVESYEEATITVQEQSLTKYNRENPWYRFEKYLTVDGAVSLSHYEVDMAGDEVFQLGVYGANSKIEWTSSNPSVAYANQCGLIVALGITGSTVITAHVDGEEVKCTVIVSAQKRQKPAKALAVGAQEEKETVDPVDIIMEGVSGNPPMVNVRLVPVGACTVIDWTTSDSSVATVENGIVSVHGEGEVLFGAETENGLSETWNGDTDGMESGALAGDVNDDGVVNTVDLEMLIGYLLSPAGSTINLTAADINADGEINTVDLEMLINKLISNN